MCSTLLIPTHAHCEKFDHYSKSNCHSLSFLGSNLNGGLLMGKIPTHTIPAFCDPMWYCVLHLLLVFTSPFPVSSKSESFRGACRPGQGLALSSVIHLSNKRYNTMGVPEQFDHVKITCLLRPCYSIHINKSETFLIMKAFILL